MVHIKITKDFGCALIEKRDGKKLHWTSQRNDKKMIEFMCFFPIDLKGIWNAPSFNHSSFNLYLLSGRWSLTFVVVNFLQNDVSGNVVPSHVLCLICNKTLWVKKKNLECCNPLLKRTYIAIIHTNCYHLKFPWIFFKSNEPSNLRGFNKNSYKKFYKTNKL